MMKKERPNSNVTYNDDEAQEKYDQLRDDNIHLKQRHKQLEEHIKIIAVKLKRVVG